MARPESRLSGWRGIALVCVTYVYFLIFAQFAFLKRLAELGIADAHLKAVMAAMAAGGIVLSLLAPRIAACPSPQLRLQAALATTAAASLLTLLPLGLAAGIAVSFLIGGGLGLLTVTLVTHLRAWLGNRNTLLKVGLGTGIGYLICNFPPLFTASARMQALAAAVLCIAGIFIAVEPVFLSATEPLINSMIEPTEQLFHQASAISFARVLYCFTALVWLDSAAFFIIQSTPALKAGTWEGTLHLWANGLLHLVAALASGCLLRRRGLSFVLSAAWMALACACLLLLNPHHVLLASVFYPVGVSLYSVALVAYPSLLAPAASVAERGRMAGWIYAIAGWFGSAMGIGMGQNLGHVPPAFVLLAGVLVLGPLLLKHWRQRKREFIAVGAVLIAAWCVHRAVIALQPAGPVASEIERGRRIYTSEGCINCHSQYVRPNTQDVLMWGPAQTVDELRRERPPLIGNRRQGPDLAEVGSRRSRLWLKAHFYHPSEVSHASFMPAYAYLFDDSRGNDLLAYLQNLTGPGIGSCIELHRVAEQQWQPSPALMLAASSSNGATLFNAYCATCHAADGRTRERWRTAFKRLPPNLATGPFLHLDAKDSTAQRRARLARIVKFGVPGTDMAGHEYLSDSDVGSLVAFLQ